MSFLVGVQNFLKDHVKVPKPFFQMLSGFKSFSNYSEIPSPSLKIATCLTLIH